MYNIIEYTDIMQVEDTTRWDAPPEGNSTGYDGSEYDGDAIEEPITDTP